MPTEPTEITPEGGGAKLAAQVPVIEVSGCDNDTALNGLYVSDGATPPEWTHVTTSSQTITENTGLWELQITGVDQFASTSIPNTLAPLTTTTYNGTDVTWSLTGGTGPAVPTMIRRPKVPESLTP